MIMYMYMNRDKILKQLKYNVDHNIPIVGCGAGVGLSAESEVAGGADIIVVYNSGKYRMQGRPSCYGRLPYGDANNTMLEMADKILPIVGDRIPVEAGINANDPFKDMKRLLKHIKELGFSGVQNFPCIVAYDGEAGLWLNSLGINYQKEIDMVKLAHEMDLLTTPYVYTPEQAVAMTKAGADILVVHCQMTVGGMDALKKNEVMSLDHACSIVQMVYNAAVEVRDDIMVVCHGGPISMPEDVEYVLKHTKNIAGFWAASSAERLPTEIAVRERVEAFKKIGLKGGD